MKTQIHFLTAKYARYRFKKICAAGANALRVGLAAVVFVGPVRGVAQSPEEAYTRGKSPNFFQRLFKRTPPRFKGSIDLSEPQEYSRERLISEWLNEYDVYSGILNSHTTLASTATISGAVDDRIFDLLAGKVTASFDPLKGKLDTAGANAEVSRINNQNALNDQYVQLQKEQLQGQIDQMRQERQILGIKMANELAALQAAQAATNTTGVTAVGAAPVVPSVSPSAALNAASTKAAAIDASLTAMETRLNSLVTLTNANGIFALGGLDTSGNPKQLMPSKSTVSQLPLDQLHDFEAVRNNIIAVRRKRMLDDTHDRMGSNLHHLHFRLTLTPPQKEGRLCKIEAKLGTIKYDYEYSPELSEQRFADALTTHIRRECQSLDERFGGAFPKNYRTFMNFFASAVAEQPEKTETSEVVPATKPSASQETLPLFRQSLTDAKMFLFRARSEESPTLALPSSSASTDAAKTLIPVGSRDIEDIASLLSGGAKAEIEASYLKERYKSFAVGSGDDRTDFCIIKEAKTAVGTVGKARILAAVEKAAAIEEAKQMAAASAVAAIEKANQNAAHLPAADRVAAIKTAKVAAEKEAAATMEAAEIKATAIEAEKIAKAELDAAKAAVKTGNFASGSDGAAPTADVLNLVLIKPNEAFLTSSKRDAEKNPVCDVTANENGQTKPSRLEQFAGKFDRLRKHCSVIAVEPSEYAQNISSVAAYERVRSFVATVSAALTNGASLGGELQSMLRTQKVMDSILRKPLAVGFIKSRNDPPQKEEDSFGWYLGPRFEVKEDKGFFLLGRPKVDVAYSHAEAVYDLEFTMVTPALATEVEVTYRAIWIDPKTGEEDTSIAPLIMKKVLKLTPDYSAFVNGILQHHEGNPSGPLLSTSSSSEVSTSKGYAVTLNGASANSTVTAVNVVGSDLWRSPEVYLDGIRADSIKIDPDMHGLRAEFTTLPQCYDGFADLTIVTSTGRDSLIDWVRVFDIATEKQANIPPPRVRSHQMPKEETEKDKVDYATLIQTQMPVFVETTENRNVWDYTKGGPGTDFLLRVASSQRPMLNGKVIPLTWSAKLVPVNIAQFAGIACTISPGQPYFKLKPSAPLDGVDGFNTVPPIIEVGVQVFASVSEWPKPIEVTASLHPSVIFFRDENATKLTYVKAATVPDQIGGLVGRLTLPEGADRDLYLRGWGGLAAAVKDPAKLKLRVKNGDPLPVEVQFSNEPEGMSFALKAGKAPAKAAAKPETADTAASKAKGGPPPPATAEPAAEVGPKAYNSISGDLELVVEGKAVIPIIMPAK